jgi:hypothetical protein
VASSQDLPPGVYGRYAVTWRPWPPPVDVAWILYVLALVSLIGIFGKWKLAGQHSVVADWRFAAPVVGLPAAIAVAMLSLVYVVLRGDTWRAYRANRRRFGDEVDLVDRLRDEDRSRVADPCIWGQACTAQHMPGEPLATAAAPVADHDEEQLAPPWTAGRYAIAGGSAILVATGLVLSTIFISSGICGRIRTRARHSRLPRAWSAHSYVRRFSSQPSVADEPLAWASWNPAMRHWRGRLLPFARIATRQLE